jgi:uncharacterized membrane protein YfhO
VAYVDGEKAEISLVGNCMVSLPLTEGDHTIDLRYENQAFRLGAWISAGSAGVLLLFTGVDLLLHRKKKA